MAAQKVHPGTDRYSMAELMTICMSRVLSGDQEKSGGGGANAVIPLAAARLAQITVAPNLWLSTGGAGSINGKFDALPLGTWDPRCDIGAECKQLMMDVVDKFMKGPPGGTRFHTGDGMGSLGGLQIDKFGNINMIGVGTWPQLKVRGPGTVGTIWHGADAHGIFLEHHNSRVLVDRVDFISGAGWLSGGSSRADVLNDRKGPPYVWTPIAVLDFTEVEHRARLVSVHPGYTVKDVVDNTGFELVIEGDVPTTTEPTDWELTQLRNASTGMADSAPAA